MDNNKCVLNDYDGPSITTTPTITTIITPPPSIIANNNNNNNNVSITSNINNDKLSQNQLQQSFRAMLTALANQQQQQQNSPPGLNSPASTNGGGGTVSIASPGSAFAYLHRTDLTNSPSNVITSSGTGAAYETTNTSSTIPSSCGSAGSAFSQPPTPLNRVGGNNSIANSSSAMLAAALTNPANLSLLAFYQNSIAPQNSQQSTTTTATTNPLNNLVAFEQISKLINSNNPIATAVSGNSTSGLDQYLMLQKFQQQLQQQNPRNNSTTTTTTTTLPTILPSGIYQHQQQQQHGFDQISATTSKNCSTSCNSLISPASSSANDSMESLQQQPTTIRKIRRRRPKSPRLVNGSAIIIGSATKHQYPNNYKLGNIRAIKNSASNFQKQQQQQQSFSGHQQASSSPTTTTTTNISPREEAFLKEQQQRTPEDPIPSWVLCGGAGGVDSQHQQRNFNHSNNNNNNNNNNNDNLQGSGSGVGCIVETGAMRRPINNEMLSGKNICMINSRNNINNNNNNEADEDDGMGKLDGMLMHHNGDTSGKESCGESITSGGLCFDESLDDMDSSGKMRYDAASLKRRQKMCLVCGDQATGYNFNVITCESCKAFFRRNALRPKDFKCPYNEECEINTVSRRFCQKCRLKKCFDVGMKKEWILNEDQLRRRKNSRLNSLKSCHGNNSLLQQQQQQHLNNNLQQQQQFSPTYNNQSCHNYSNKTSTIGGGGGVFSPESGILSPKPLPKGSFMSTGQQQQQQQRRNPPMSAFLCESTDNSPQSSSSSSLLFDLSDYNGLMVGSGVMRPRNGSAGSSAFFGSRTSSHCSVELPTINSPLGGVNQAKQLSSPTSSNLSPLLLEVESPTNPPNNSAIINNLPQFDPTNLMRLTQQISANQNVLSDPQPHNNHINNNNNNNNLSRSRSDTSNSSTAAVAAAAAAVANHLPSNFMDSLLFQRAAVAVQQQPLSQQQQQQNVVDPTITTTARGLSVEDYQRILRLNGAMDFGKIFGNQNYDLQLKTGFLANYQQQQQQQQQRQNLAIAAAQLVAASHNSGSIPQAPTPGPPSVVNPANVNANIEVEVLSPPAVLNTTNTTPTTNNNMIVSPISSTTSIMDQVVDVVTPIFSPTTTNSFSQQTTISPQQQQQQPSIPQFLSTTNLFQSQTPPSTTTTTTTKYSREHLEFMKQQIRIMDVAIQDELDKSPDSCYDYEPSGDFVEKLMAEYDSKKRYKLTDDELAEIEIIQNVYCSMEDPLDIQSTMRAAKYIVKDNHDPADIMNIMNIAMRRFVKASKSLPTFKEISDDGKFFLLKNSMIDLLTIRGATRLDMANQCFKSNVIGGRNISCSMFDRLNDPYQKERFIRFCQTLHPSIRNNPVAIHLLNVVVLYSRYDRMLHEADRIKAHQLYDKYMTLLRRYLEMAYEEEAASLMTTVPKMLKELADISQRAATLFLGLVNQSDTEALPTEFFKIDNNNMPITTTTTTIVPPPSPSTTTTTIAIKSTNSNSLALKTETIELSTTTTTTNIVENSSTTTTTATSTTPPGISALKIDSPN